MSEQVGTGDQALCGPVSDGVSAALARFEAAVDELLEVDAARLSLPDLRAIAKVKGIQADRLRHGQRANFHELDSRGVLTALKLRGLADLIGAETRCSRKTARAQAQAIERFSPRRGLTGETLEPTFAVAAVALAGGEVGLEHGTVIAEAIESLPDKVRAERGTEVETTLVDLAREKNPEALRLLAGRIIAHLDPDGPEPEETEQRQHSRRRLALFPHPDGSASVEGQLTPACYEIWRAILASLAKQKPDEQKPDDSDGDNADTRTDAQRNHDAFEEAGRRLLATKDLPSNAGLATTMIIRIDLTDLENRIGRATTHHGGTITVNEALRVAADGGLIPVVLGDGGEILTLGREHRLADKAQRRALFARDRGCTFPDCPKTAAQSEIHHATEWIHGGKTDVDSMAVVCGYHNNEAPRQGWQTLMINGIPHWKPPKWRDPGQRLQRNYLHHPELVKRDLVPEPHPGDLTEPANSKPGRQPSSTGAG